VEKKEVVQLLLFCLTVGGFAMFLQKCYESQMILRRYYLFLNYHYIKNWQRDNRYKREILKPLGLCVYCQSTWIALITYPMLFNLDVYYLLHLGGVYLTIKLLNGST